MRTPRIVILVFFFSASLFLVLRSLGSFRDVNDVTVKSTSSTVRKSSFRALFSFTSPFSLFPSNAAISLTDDNSTFFPARPAAFGPPLPSDGLSGRLWIGSGFSDEHLQEGEGEGELGCSDIPGWEDGASKSAIKPPGQGSPVGKSAAAALSTTHTKRDGFASVPPVDRIVTRRRHDGTDDYLHQDLEQTRGAYGEGSGASGSSHADIQSMQETAEITGKIALLSRGGCGFLEKVKWAQRRGAIALIVGDNQKGGPLIQMFARGNVDNVTIPSIFTSRTTAILLSSLMQPGSFIEDILDENGKPILKVQHSSKPRKTNKQKSATPAASRVGKSAPKSKATRSGSTKEELALSARKSRTPRRSWLSRLFHWSDGDDGRADRSRPPSSGRLDWVVVDERSDENGKIIKTSLDKVAEKGGETSASSEIDKASGDGFQIGVQDWRDPDLVDTPAESGAGSSPQAKGSGENDELPKEKSFTRYGGEFDPSSLRGGSITPGSGEYDPTSKGASRTSKSGKSDSASPSQGGLMSKLFGDEQDDAAPDDGFGPSFDTVGSATSTLGGNDGDDDKQGGLWVTITPTGSASAFFDTLGVLVISPLVTLSVVYTLLFVRAKVRRRRWRAPKSVVDQLPVRTYHTVDSSSPTQSPRVPSTNSASPTTPLLQDSSWTRPRSRTTTGIPEAGGGGARVGDDLQAPRPSPENQRVSNEWATRHKRRQTECVICLEDYIDGVSKVMSLPCGHEFHVDCITPWLTTRRRTCPICKGDVVRSMARRSRPRDVESGGDDENPRAAAVGSSQARNHGDFGFFGSRNTRSTRSGIPGAAAAADANPSGTTAPAPSDVTGPPPAPSSENTAATASTTPRMPVPDIITPQAGRSRVREAATWVRQPGETAEDHMIRLKREWEQSDDYRSRVWYDSNGRRQEPWSAWNHHTPSRRSGGSGSYGDPDW